MNTRTIRINNCSYICNDSYIYESIREYLDKDNKQDFVIDKPTKWHDSEDKQDGTAYFKVPVFKDIKNVGYIVVLVEPYQGKTVTIKSISKELI